MSLPFLEVDNGLVSRCCQNFLARHGVWEHWGYARLEDITTGLVYLMKTARECELTSLFSQSSPIPMIRNSIWKRI